jgi:methyl-accepting chemotaxis protein
MMCRNGSNLEIKGQASAGQRIQEMKNFRYLIPINVFLVALAIGSATSFFISEIYVDAQEKAEHILDNNLRTFWELVKSKGDGFHVVKGKLMVGDYVLNGNFELPDKIKGFH